MVSAAENRVLSKKPIEGQRCVECDERSVKSKGNCYRRDLTGRGRGENDILLLNGPTLVLRGSPLSY